MTRKGFFCKIYGATIRNRVLEYLLESQDSDFAIGDMAEDVGISRPKAYQIMDDFEKKKYVKKSRIISKTQLYILNKENRIVELFLKDFKECLKIIMEEYEAKNQKRSAGSGKSVSLVARGV